MGQKSDLERVREWLKTFPRYEEISNFFLDYTDQVPGSGGIFPGGLVEVSRKRDILGNTTVENRYNFSLYCNLAKAPGDDEGAAINADLVHDLQVWVQEQSITGKAPVFGDMPRRERITAQNGMLVDADDEGTALYMIQLSIDFIKFFEVNNNA